MARRKETPTNLAAADRADTLRKASAQLVKAQEGLETARAPVKAAKAVVKAAGIDHDIFRLFHGIRHAEDDEQRNRRLRMIEVAWDALLGDVTTADLFRGTARPALAPEVVQDLRDASDALHEEEPQDEELPFDTDGAEEAGEPNFDDGGVAQAENGDAEPAADLPVIMTAESMPADAGAIANDGYAQGRAGVGPEMNPHEADSTEHALWERGRQRGAAAGPENSADEAIAEPAAVFDPNARFTGSTEQKRIQAYWHGYRGTEAGCESAALLAGRRGEIKTQITAGIADFNGKVPPRYSDPDAPAVAGEPPAVEEGVEADAGKPPHRTEADAASSSGWQGVGEDGRRVAVQNRDGKLVLVDLVNDRPLIDVPSGYTGEAWAKNINAHFAGRLDTVTNSDLKEAAKTLAMGRVLEPAAAFRGHTGVSPADLAAAV